MIVLITKYHVSWLSVKDWGPMNVKSYAELNHQIRQMNREVAWDPCSIGIQ